MPRADQHLVDLLADPVARRHAEQPERRRIDRADREVRVEREHARADAAQDDLHLRAPPLEVLAVALQVRGHPVEAVHQRRDLVVPAALDPHVEVAGADLGGREAELRDRLRPTPGTSGWGAVASSSRSRLNPSTTPRSYSPCFSETNLRSGSSASGRSRLRSSSWAAIRRAKKSEVSSASL